MNKGCPSWKQLQVVDDEEKFQEQDMSLAQVLRSKYPEYKEYVELKRMFEKFGYKVDEYKDDVIVYKKL